MKKALSPLPRVSTFRPIAALLLALSLPAWAQTGAQYTIPIYHNDSNQLIIHAGLGGGPVEPYLLDSGSPNMFATYGSWWKNGPAPATKEGPGTFTFASGTTYHYKPYNTSVSLGDNQGNVIVTATTVNVAQITNTGSSSPVTDAANWQAQYDKGQTPFSNGTFGNFSAGLYGTNTLGTVLAQVPLAPGYRSGFVVMAGQANATSGQLLVGLSQDLIAQFRATPGAIVLPMAKVGQGQRLPGVNGAPTTGPYAYQKSQVNPATVTLKMGSDSYMAQLPAVLDTGGGPNTVLYQDQTSAAAVPTKFLDLKKPTDNSGPVKKDVAFTLMAQELGLSSQGTIVQFLSQSKTENNGFTNLPVDGDYAGSSGGVPRINPGVPIFYNLNIMFDLADGYVVLAPNSADPLNGYKGYTAAYTLPYSNSPGFGAANPKDPAVNLIIGKTPIKDMPLDTGSRALYVSTDALPGLKPTGPVGHVYLNSSARIFGGTFSTEKVTFPDAVASGGASAKAAATLPVLVVQYLEASTTPPPGQTVAKTTFGTIPSSGTVKLAGGGTVPIESEPSGGGFITLLGGQRVNYADNPGILGTVMNFGVGFDRTGLGTVPIGNQYNQQYNAFLNLEDMVQGKMRAGYVLEQDHVKLGLTTDTKGYAYTNLLPTGLRQVAGSPPDWQAPTGTLKYKGITYATGQLVVDIGIPSSILTLPGQPTSGTATPGPVVNLINSGGAVSYTINRDSSNILNPSTIAYFPPLAGSFSENQLMAQNQFFNTGRHVLNAFNFLYDGTAGYVGLQPNGNSVPSARITFTAGFYPTTELTPQTISFPPIANVTFGVAPFSTGASASSGLPLTYTYGGPITISGNTITVTGAGLVKIRAQQEGNSTYTPAASVLQSFTVAPATQTIDFPAIPDQTVGAKLTLQATASSGLPINYTSTGPATLSKNVLTFTGKGVVEVTAHQPGNAGYAPAPDVAESILVK